MKNFFNPTTNSMSRVIQRMEWTLLGVSIAMHLINNYVLKAGVDNLHFGFFCGLVTLLIFTTPLQQSTLVRELYAFGSLLIMIGADVTGNGSGILFYWTIVKFSFFLPLRSVISIVLMGGGIYAGSTILNYSNIIANAARSGVLVNITPQALVIGQFSSYLGISILCVLLSNLFVSEQRSRLRAEELTKEMESLAATLERKRIARDIHDALGHTLTTLDIQLELAQKLRARDPEQALVAIDQAKILTTQCLQDVRSAVQNIRKEPFDLNQSLPALIDRLRPSFNIQVQLDLPILPLQPSHQLYCILQEGFTNIQKHAVASEVQLRGWYDDGNLWVQLQDNGQGFGPTDVGRGFGLRSMAERAQLLGGQLDVKSTPEQGTCLSLSIPLVAR
jgi:signal transduction histidine kinase